jgi:hypothetical protein
MAIEQIGENQSRTKRYMNGTAMAKILILPMAAVAGQGCTWE